MIKITDEMIKCACPDIYNLKFDETICKSDNGSCEKCWESAKKLMEGKNDSFERLSILIDKMLLDKDEFEELKNICPNVLYHSCNEKYPDREYFTVSVGNCYYDIFVKKENK